MHPKSIESRFWSKVKKSDGCWLWTGATPGNRYGVMRPKGRVVLTHRYSWELHYGPIPAGMFVCHHCDTMPCVRPDHLFLGTQADNIADKVAKGRQAMGSRHGMSKFTDDDVREIKRLLANGVSQPTIAAQFGVNRMTINRINTGKHYDSIE